MILQNYIEVNRALNDILFSGRFEGRPFYFSLDSRSQHEVAVRLNISPENVEDHISKVVGGALKTDGNPYAKHLSKAKKWWYFYKDKEFPPFTAILFALSHAAELMAADDDFGGGNYYDRLAGVLEFPKGKLSFHGKSTEFFWKKLNAWLALNNYEFGRPTAKIFNTWKYVNYPQSQAIVRAGDRHLFHELFEEYGFTGSEALQIDEIGPYIDAWMRSSKANSRLRATWRRMELRERLCEVALAELEDWARLERVGGGSQAESRKLRLSLVATLIPQFPRQRLDLYLGRAGSGIVDQVRFAHSGCQSKAELANDAFGSVASLTPNPIYQSVGIMESGLDAASIGAGPGVKWRSKLVIPMRKSPDGPYWVEIARVGVATEHLVLVRDVPGIKKEVDVLLAAASTQEASIATPEKLSGLPKGWLAYIGVRIIRSDVHVEGVLEPLVPMQETDSDFFLEGGMKLANGIWHTSCPPSVVFQTREGDSSLQVCRDDGGGSWEAPSSSSEAQEDTVTGGQLTGLVEDGEYKVKACVSGEVSGILTLLLRSAKRPRPVNRSGSGKLFYLNPISAVPANEIGEEKANLSGNRNSVLSGPSSVTSDIPCGFEEHRSRVYADAIASSGVALGCVALGHHHWICEPEQEGKLKSAPVRMECENCGQSVLMKNRGKARLNVPIVPPKAWQASDTEVVGIEHDLVLDAICFLGSGTVSRIEALLAGMIAEPWRVGQLVSDYVALGLIDAQLVQGSGRFEAWSVPAPSIYFIGKHDAFLAGFRSEELVAQVRGAVEAAGGQASVAFSTNMPSHIILSGLDHRGMSAAVERITDPLDRAVQLIPDASRYIARQISQLASMGAIMKPIALSNDPAVQVFDCMAASWRKSINPLQAGALRLGWAGTTYVYRRSAKHALSGPHQLVKLLAARDKGLRLHAYDERSCRFLSTLGAEPMGLLARALVACSGKLPAISNGVTIYENVPSEVAQIILHLLYEEPIIP